MTNFDRDFPTGRFLTEEEAAEFISFSPRTLQAWRQRNIGPPFLRIQRSIRYSEAALTSWMRDQIRQPGGGPHDS